VIFHHEKNYWDNLMKFFDCLEIFKDEQKEKHMAMELRTEFTEPLRPYQSTKCNVLIKGTGRDPSSTFFEYSSDDELKTKEKYEKELCKMDKEKLKNENNEK